MYGICVTFLFLYCLYLFVDSASELTRDDTISLHSGQSGEPQSETGRHACIRMYVYARTSSSPGTACDLLNFDNDFSNERDCTTGNRWIEIDNRERIREREKSGVGHRTQFPDVPTDVGFTVYRAEESMTGGMQTAG